MKRMEAQTIASFLHSLSLVDRKVMVLHYAEQLNTREIGWVLRIPKMAVEQTLVRLQEHAREFIATRGSGRAA